MSDKVRFSLMLPQKLMDELVRAAAQETLDTGNKVSVSEYIRVSCEERIEFDRKYREHENGEPATVDEAPATGAPGSDSDLGADRSAAVDGHAAAGVPGGPVDDVQSGDEPRERDQEL